jgi:hypothetical protein
MRNPMRNSPSPKSGLNQLFSTQRTAQLLPLWRLRSNLAREVCIVADPYRTPIFAFTLLCDETLRPPVGQRSPQPLKGTKGKESQPNQTGNNVDGPHTSHDINILVVLEFAVKLPWSPLEEELAAQAGHKVVTQRCASHCSQPTLHRHQNAVPNQQEQN